MIISTEERGTKNIFVPTGIAVGCAWNSTPIDGAYILRSILAIGRELHFLLYVNINVLPKLTQDNNHAALEYL